MAICTRTGLPASGVECLESEATAGKGRGTCIDLSSGRVRPRTPLSRADERQPGWSRTPDDEPSPLLRRLGGNGLAHLRSRVSQRPSAPRTQLPDLRVGPGCSPRVELPIELAQTLVRRAQRIELEYLIPQTKHVRDRPTRHDASYRRRAPPRHHSVSCSPPHGGGASSPPEPPGLRGSFSSTNRTTSV